jgi:peptidyl-prolyl cis-trans isomerase D
MLQSIRDRSQSWLMGVVIFLACAAFALWGIHSYLGDSSQPDIVAKVNGQTIHQTELNQAYERLRQQQQTQLGADFVFDQKIASQLKQQALNQLIMGSLLTQAARTEGFRVSIDEVKSALLMIPAFQVNGQFSLERFNEVLSSILYTENQFLADLQTTMLTEQVRSGFVNSEFALPNEIETAVKLVNQKRDINYLVIPAARFMDEAKISDADALAYYNQHLTQFIMPEQVSIDYIELSLPQIAAQQHFDDTQLQQFYQTNISNYTTPERWHVARLLIKVPANASAQQIAQAKTQINDLMQRLQKGEDFSKLVKQYSDDKVSAAKDGVMDWFSSGTVDPAIEKIVAALAKPGDVSAPIQTQEGFNLIKLIDVQKSQVQAFAKVRAQVEKAMAQQQAEHIFADASDKLSNLTYTNPSSLDAAAKTLNLPVKVSGLFTHQGGKDAITSNPKVYTAAFNSDVLSGNNSDVIELDPDTLLVLRIKQHKAASTQAFSAVRNQVISQLQAQTAKQHAKALGAQILQQLAQGKNIAEVAKQNAVTLSTASNITRFGSQIPATLRSAAYRMAKPNATTKFTATGISMPNGDFAVLLLTAVYEGATPANRAEVEGRVYREQLENSAGQLSYALYVRDLEKKAKININKQSEEKTP